MATVIDAKVPAQKKIKTEKGKLFYSFHTKSHLRYICNITLYDEFKL